ncbi:glycosyltransferase [Iningainema tapete]|nr:glycosyltransferase [Iningainema tapete]
MKDSKRMKILFYCGGFAPVGGVETFCKNLLTHLKTKHHNCTLLCWGQKSPLLKSTQDIGVTIVRNPWRWGCIWNVPDWLLLPTGLKQIQHADVVLFGKLFPLQILKLIRAQAGAKKRMVFITSSRPTTPDNYLEKKHLLEALNVFDLILVQSSLFIESLHHIGYKGRIEVLPLPHYYGTVKPLPVKELKIGFLGRLVKEKNVPLILEAFRCFQQKYLKEFMPADGQTQPSLHLFGDGYLRQELEQLTRELEISNSVIFHGNIPYDQIEDAIASCHLFVFASHIEGQCLAALEILSCGRPLVATDAGALPDILSDSRLGKLVEYVHPENFANSVMETVKLINEQSMTPESIRSAYLERYEPKQISDRYIEILNSLN